MLKMENGFEKVVQWKDIPVINQCEKLERAEPNFWNRIYINDPKHSNPLFNKDLGSNP